MWAEKKSTIVSVWHLRSVRLVLSVCFLVSFVFSVCLCKRHNSARLSDCLAVLPDVYVHVCLSQDE